MPYVVSASIPSSGIQPSKYVLTLDAGTAFEVDPQTLGDASMRLHYDVSTVASGNHRITVAAKNIWGVSTAVPFDFAKSVPATPTGLTLEP
jgi:hypothetical protein